MTTPTEPIDTTVPSVARAYDYMLGGKDNFASDRKFAQSIVEKDPELAVSIKLNKEFGRQVTDYIVRQGVTQFLDLGSGIPTSPPSVHDTARKVQPEARVVYVDNDAAVAAHNRALRTTSSGLATLQADLTDPDAVFNSHIVQSELDLSKPIAVLLMSVLQTTVDERDAYDLLRNIRSRMAPGSYLAISHVSDRSSQQVKDAIAQSIKKFNYPPSKLRTDAQVEALFDGFELVEPGVTDYQTWRSDPGHKPRELNTQFVGGVGRLRD